MIISVHKDEVLKIEACNEGHTGSLCFIYDKISIHVRGLAPPGVSSEQYGSLLIPIIVLKLPSDVRLQIAQTPTV